MAAHSDLYPDMFSSVNTVMDNALRSSNIIDVSEMKDMLYSNSKLRQLEDVDPDINVFNGISLDCYLILPENVSTFDLIAVTETWLTSVTADLVSLPGYNIVCRNNRGGGVVIDSGYKKYVQGFLDTFVLFECLPFKIIDVVKNIKNSI
ncbi:hypothetical protein HELRODRAFT_158644 [Helobdella robusta]|uniref:Uncharacterized protein n=1 Tax=Helobdella robusta TaxID=6412 RepID=T1EN27_HELRO|nr:hypothetical protein HELRODRAFT_158644 [Helobdella robusta]ESO12180.1 hypothetical protein HELRODRAFT_158644 [Helobdella robusta]